MNYRILSSGLLFIAQYWRGGTWRVLQRQPAFTTYDDAWNWLLIHRFSDNEARALLHIYPA